MWGLRGKKKRKRFVAFVSLRKKTRDFTKDVSLRTVVG
jgi:hypothetical protein